jgi:hypothetical protein
MWPPVVEAEARCRSTRRPYGPHVVVP